MKLKRRMTFYAAAFVTALLWALVMSGCVMSDSYLENKRPAREPGAPYVPEPEAPEESSQQSVSSAVAAPAPEPLRLAWRVAIPIVLVTSTNLVDWTEVENATWDGLNVTVTREPTDPERYWAVQLNGQIIRVDN